MIRGRAKDNRVSKAGFHPHRRAMGLRRGPP
jgi:hypothetical protein